MAMEKGLDTGAMLDVSVLPIDRKTAGQLTDEFAVFGARRMVDVLGKLPLVQPTPQPVEGVTYAAKIDKAEAHLDFRQSAEQVERSESRRVGTECVSKFRSRGSPYH